MCFVPQWRALFRIPPKVLRDPMFFTVLTFWRGGVDFFDIRNSKSGPELVCFVQFDFQICVALQWRAIFRRLIFQKWSGHGVFCTF